jgi:hypothetical protein
MPLSFVRQHKKEEKAKKKEARLYLFAGYSFIDITMIS